MVDDIVTRLREQTKGCEWCNCDCCEHRHCLDCENTSLAVDEIERLRGLLIIATHHLDDALYSDEWNAREYCIAFHSNLAREFSNG